MRRIQNLLVEDLLNVPRRSLLQPPKFFLFSRPGNKDACILHVHLNTDLSSWQDKKLLACLLDSHFSHPAHPAPPRAPQPVPTLIEGFFFFGFREHSPTNILLMAAIYFKERSSWNSEMQKYNKAVGVGGTVFSTPAPGVFKSAQGSLLLSVNLSLPSVPFVYNAVD